MRARKVSRSTTAHDVTEGKVVPLEDVDNVDVVSMGDDGGFGHDLEMADVTPPMSPVPASPRLPPPQPQRGRAKMLYDGPLEPVNPFDAPEGVHTYAAIEDIVIEVLRTRDLTPDEVRHLLRSLYRAFAFHQTIEKAAATGDKGAFKLNGEIFNLTEYLKSLQ